MTPGSNIEHIDYDISGVHLSGFIRKGVWPTYFYFWGNASEAYKSFASLSMSGTIISFNYRWYGWSSGEPSEDNLFQDAVILYDLLEKDGYLKQEETILFGRSLGSGVASYLSSIRPSKAIILVTPFDSLLALGKEQYPIVPVKWLLRHHFLSVDYLQGYTHPILIIYGWKDLAIPNSRTKNLIAHLPKSTMTHFIEGATHDDIHVYHEYREVIEQFEETFSWSSVLP